MSAWLKLALGVAIAAAVAAIGATLLVGARVREDTVVARPYEEGLRHAACDPAARTCTRPLPGGGEVTLELGPRPIRTMTELAVRVEIRGQPPEASAEQVVVAFSMPGMAMGHNEARLAPAGAGRFAGTAVLVRCPSGRRDWTAEVRVGGPGATPRVARFELIAEEGR